jgi:putative Holliday junction resolvase
MPLTAWIERFELEVIAAGNERKEPDLSSGDGARVKGKGPPGGGGACAKAFLVGSRAGGRTCALDLGGARVGVAIDDELGSMAHPRGVLDGRDRPGLLRALAKLAEDEGIARFVVGLPLDMKGGEGEAARKARALAQDIADATGRDVELVDERLTTVQARRSLEASEVFGKKQKARIDEASATAILQAWLDARPRRRR